MKIEIELTDGDFKYKGFEIWAYEEEGTYYRIDRLNEKFAKLSDAISFIDNHILLKEKRKEN